jgi:hypothetical protein
MNGVCDPRHIVTQVWSRARCPKALIIKRKDTVAQRQVSAGFRASTLQDHREQNQSSDLRFFRLIHLFGVPVLWWACRALSQPRGRRVFGYRFAFETYHPLDGGYRLYQGAPEAGLPRGVAA